MSKRDVKRASKCEKILNAAFKVFTEHGYAGASMDLIATKSRVSKPTVYQYFGSKQDLFASVMKRGDVMLKPFQTPSPTGMVGELHAFAWAYADIVMNPEFLSLARLVIGEAQRFPEIGRAYQKAGPDRILAAMIAYLGQRRDDGKLKFDDAELAAQDLWALILSAPRNTALHIPDAVPTRREIKRSIDNGLKIFLAAYSLNSAVDIEQLRHIIKDKKDARKHHDAR